MLNSYYENADKYLKYSHLVMKQACDMGFHMDDRFEIYFFISGYASYFIEKSVYQLKYGDLFVVNSNEIHKASYQSGDSYERIIIMFDPSIGRIFGSEKLDLLGCFMNRPKGEQNKISLCKTQVEELMRYFSRLDALSMEQSDHAKLLRLTCFIELLAFINKVFKQTEPVTDTSVLSDKLQPVLDYIDSNLGGDLSLRHLGNRFFISSYYLGSLFKRHTGMNIHEYIVMKRISKAKIYLSEGYNITEVCQMSGFGDYSHFIRSFKNLVGASPGRYRKNFR